MINFDLDRAKAILKHQLDRTKTKCEDLSCGVENQERHYNVIVPRVIENRHKASNAYNHIERTLAAVTAPNELFYFLTDLSYHEGLFYRIYRGRANKHLIAKEELLKSLKFKK